VIWELVFMLVILKIPVVYLCWVVWWAVRAEPEPLEGAPVSVTVPARPQAPECTWRRRRADLLRRGPRPNGGGRIGSRGRVSYARGRLAP
jgi:hypothetical protein